MSMPVTIRVRVSLAVELGCIRWRCGRECFSQEDVVDDWLAGQWRYILLGKSDSLGIVVERDDLVNGVGMGNSGGDESDRSTSAGAL